MIRVQYLGQKVTNVDTLFRTGLTWHGHGDVQFVDDDKIAKKMTTCCPGTYRLITNEEHQALLEKQASQTDPTGYVEAMDPINTIMVMEPTMNQEVPLGHASREAVVAHAHSLGMRVEEISSRQEIVDNIANYMSLLDNPAILTAQQAQADEVQAMTEDRLAQPQIKVEKPEKGANKSMNAKTSAAARLVLVDWMTNLDEMPTVEECLALEGVPEGFVSRNMRDELWAFSEPGREIRKAESTAETLEMTAEDGESEGDMF